MKKYCHQPYEHCEIDNKGEVYVCCNKWTNYYSFGNILEQNFDEIWNGERAQKFREQFQKQSFEFCRLDICPLYLNEDVENSLIAEFPKFIRLNFDETCNVKCVFCRNKNEKRNDNSENMYNAIKKWLPEINKNYGMISLNGVGEVFCSKLSIDLIRTCIMKYPNIKFAIITNGILCSQTMLENLGLQDKIYKIEISVHATTEKTYNKLIKDGNYKKLKANLKYISKLVKMKKIEKCCMNFVVTKENYKEMLPFIKWARKLGSATQFLPLLPAYDENVFNELNILRDTNSKEYKEFEKIMQNPIFKSHDVLVPEEYLSLAKDDVKHSLLNIFKIFKQ